jgi:hypothetical protein
MNDKRNSLRKKSQLKVLISHPGQGRVVGRIRDMSDRGVFLDVYQSVLFECGQIVGARIIGDSGIDMNPMLSMEIVRVELNGIALKFVEVSEGIADPCIAYQ